MSEKKVGWTYNEKKRATSIHSKLIQEYRISEYRRYQCICEIICSKEKGKLQQINVHCER